MKANLRNPFLVICASIVANINAHAASNTWSGPANGTWDTVTSNWTSPTTWTSGDDAIFAGSATTVSIATGGVTAHHLDFNTTGYTIEGEALTLNGTTPTITAGTGISAVISSTIAGAAGLTKAGNGTLTLSNAATYTGSTAVDAGTLVLQGSYASSAFSIATNAALEFNVAGGSRDYTTSTSFTGTGSIIKTGIGEARWGASVATFALSAGALIDVQAGIFGAGSYGNDVWTNNKSDLNVAASATFDSAAANTYFNALTGAGTVILAYNNGYPRTMTLGVADGSGAYSGTLVDGTNGGNGKVVKTGTGTQIFTGANTYSGGTTISGGTLNVGNGGSTGSLGSGAIVNNGALIFDLVGAATTAALPTGGITGSGTLSVTANTIVFNGNVTTSGNQSYTATANSAALYRGGNINAASVALTATGGASISLSGDYGKTGGNGNTLALDTSAGNGAINLDVSFGRFNAWYGLTAFTANAGTGAITVSGSRGVSGWSATTSSLTGTITISSDILNNSAMTLNAIGASTVSGVLSGSGSLIKTGASKLTISSANTYTGGTTVENGILELNASSAIKNGTALTINGGTVSLLQANNSISSLSAITINAGGTLSADAGLNQAHTVNNLIQLNGGTLAGNANNNATFGQFYMGGANANIAASGLTQSTISATLGLGGSLYGYNKITVDADASLLISGKLQGVSGSTWGGFAKLGAGTLTLTNTTSTYGMGMQLNAGTVEFATDALKKYSCSDSGHKTGYAVDFTGNATLRWATGNTQDISAPNAYNGQIRIGDGVTATFDTNGNDVTFATAFVLGGSGTGALTKSGAGTLTISGSNSYTGATTVSAGILLINGSLSSSSAVTVNGGTLGGSGGSVGSVTVNSGGTFAPGNSIGTLVIDGDLVLAGTSNFEINAATNAADLAIVSANLLFGGALNVTNLAGTLSGGQSFELFQWGTTSGSFSSVSLPALSGGLSWDQSNLYSAGVIAVIPEPSAATLLASLGSLLVLRRRRRC